MVNIDLIKGEFNLHPVGVNLVQSVNVPDEYISSYALNVMRLYNLYHKSLLKLIYDLHEEIIIRNRDISKEIIPENIISVIPFVIKDVKTESNVLENIPVYAIFTKDDVVTFFFPEDDITTKIQKDLSNKLALFLQKNFPHGYLKFKNIEDLIPDEDQRVNLKYFLYMNMVFYITIDENIFKQQQF